MLKRLIRWLARAELRRIEAGLVKQRIEINAKMAATYVNGFNIGRAIGNNEMLAHLRGDVSEPVTTELVARRAAGMVH